jgi:hypothetical protein
MQEIDNSEISLSDSQREVVFIWNEFDGDDCFGSLKVRVCHEDQQAEYDFGPCVVWALRKLTCFVESDMDDSVSGGFRNPDIITYELKRMSSSYEFVVECEAQGLQVSYKLENPQIQVDRSFLNWYDEDA